MPIELLVVVAVALTLVVVSNRRLRSSLGAIHWPAGGSGRAFLGFLGAQWHWVLAVATILGPGGLIVMGYWELGILLFGTCVLLYGFCVLYKSAPKSAWVILGFGALLTIPLGTEWGQHNLLAPLAEFANISSADGITTSWTGGGTAAEEAGRVTEQLPDFDRETGLRIYRSGATTVPLGGSITIMLEGTLVVNIPRSGCIDITADTNEVLMTQPSNFATATLRSLGAYRGPLGIDIRRPGEMLREGRLC